MDNSLTVQLLTNEYYDINAYVVLVYAIKYLLAAGLTGSNSYICREGNKCTDWEANAGFSLQMGLHPYAQVSDDLQ